MNILTASTLDFIDHLRKLAKGWRIEPMVLCEEARLGHRGLTTVYNPPKGQSLTDFFAANAESNKYSLIRIKVPNHTLRLIQLSMLDTQIVLRYWRANGFRQNQESTDSCYRIRRRRTGGKVFDYDTQTVYETFTIERMTRGTKSRGKKRRGRPNIIHRDRIEVGAPESAMRAAILARATIEKSLEKRYDDLRTRFTRLAVIFNGDNFTYNDTFQISAHIEKVSK